MARTLYRTITAILLCGVLSAMPAHARSASDKALYAGMGYSLFVDQEQRLWGMGKQLYLAGIIAHPSDHPVLLMRDVRSVSGAYRHIVALKNDGTVWTLGQAKYGALGTGDVQQGRNTDNPAQVLADAVAVAAGDGRSYAVTGDGSLWAWGDNRTYPDSEPLGTGRKKAVYPRPVRILENVADIAAGGLQTLALMRDGSVMGWGDNICGSVGIKDKGMQYTPAKIQMPLPKNVKIVALETVELQNAALADDGSVYYWGQGDINCRADVPVKLPERIEGLDDVEKIRFGMNCVWAFKKDGTLWRWVAGPDTSRAKAQKRGGRYNAPEPYTFSSDDAIKDIAVRYDFSTVLLLKKGGTLWVAGDNGDGAIGLDSKERTIYPPVHLAFPAPGTQR